MYVAYLDDAGDPEMLPSATTPHVPPVFIVGAIAVRQDRLRSLTVSYLSLKRRFFPGLGSSSHLLDGIRAEVKGSEIRKMVRSSRRRENRQAVTFLEKVIALLEAHDVKVFGRIWVKAVGAPINKESITTHSVQACCTTFQDLLNTTSSTGAMIIDSSAPKLNAVLSHSIFTQKFKATGDSYDRIMEMPVFGHSENHAGLQLADLVASALLFPMATHGYCTGHVQNVHVHERFSVLQPRFGGRIACLQHRYYDSEGKRRGGVTVSDGLGHRPGSVLFPPRGLT
jgi:hypothetical protein